MIDDTKHLDGSTKASHTGLACEIDEILKHQVVRAHAVRWSHNLRFLTFDDSGFDPDKTALEIGREPDVYGAEIPSEARGITGQCQRCELQVPVPSGHMCASHLSVLADQGDRERSLRKYSNPCVHVCERTCSYCQHIPLFPNQGAISTFKIRRVDPNAWKHCRHFVAISYCWAAQSAGDASLSRTPYQVAEEDGSIRDIRASKSTIDRVVDFARQNGFRMIWIDQECIEQDKPSEKELAIQAMDLVYLEAHTSIALIQSHLHQKHLNALLLIYEASHGHLLRKLRGRRAFHGCRTLDLNDLSDAISIIVNDKWNTRAWVLQEAFVSSGSMTMLFPRLNEVKVTGWTLICHEMSLSEVAIRLDAIVDCIKACQTRVSIILHKRLAHVIERETAQKRSIGSRSREHGEASPSANLAQGPPVNHVGLPGEGKLFLGNQTPAGISTTQMQLMLLEQQNKTLKLGERQHKKKKKQNKRRSKSSRPDEMMLRDDHTRLEKTLKRLALFHPDKPQHDMLVSLNKSRAQRVCNAAVALTFLRLRELYSVTDKLAIVANMCGYIVRLNTVQLGKTQDSLGVCMIALSLTNGDFSLITPELYRWPPGQDHDALVVTEKKDIAEFSWSRNVQAQLEHVYSVSWNPYGNRAFVGAGYMLGVSSSGLSLLGMLWSVDRFINLVHLQRKYSDSWFSLQRNLDRTPASTVRTATTHLLFEIIQTLVAQDEIQTADSVINSTLNHKWRTSGHTGFEEGIESVRKFPPGISVENRKGMFSLDNSVDGRFHQCWIIDRIMNKGGFWVGSIVKEAAPSTAPLELARDQVEVPSKREPAASHQSQLFTSWMVSSNLGTFASTSIDEEKHEEQRDMEEAGIRTDIFSALIKQGDLASSFALQVQHLDPRGEVYQEMASRSSIFDVDGDESGTCLIFQPYHMMLESIPRPELRSMSVSWIVERVATMSPDEPESNGGNTFTTHGKVKGMWKYISVPKLERRVFLV